MSTIEIVCLLVMTALVLFVVLFVTARGIIASLSRRELILVTFILKDDQRVQIYTVADPTKESVTDEAFLLLRKRYPGHEVKNLDINPLGLASLPVASMKKSKKLSGN